MKSFGTQMLTSMFENTPLDNIKMIQLSLLRASTSGDKGVLPFCFCISNTEFRGRVVSIQFRIDFSNSASSRYLIKTPSMGGFLPSQAVPTLIFKHNNQNVLSAVCDRFPFS